MTQHITQEQATQIAAQFAEDATYEFNITNAAIQHYLDQRAKELPVLPYVPSAYGESGYIGYSKSDIQEYAKAYGQQCAAHARKLALEEAKEAIESANARSVLYVPDCIDVIEALKGK